MTIEELVIEATDQEGFPNDGEVKVWNPESCTEHDVRSVKYDSANKQLVITLEP